jgi:glycosyltransferase involved in cell wall biosynthesis
VVVPRSVRRADHVLADSTATKNDLIELYDTPPEKITVLLSGVDARFTHVDDVTARQAVREKYHIPGRPYILAVGTMQPRKNYERLIQALARLRAQRHDVDLVIVGGRGWLEDPIYETIRTTDMRDHVHFTGFADDADLPALYSEAVCVAVPSLYEGFGIPVLEGMACGTPVVTANVSSLPEVAGDAALTISPTDLDALTDALERLLTDSALRTELIRRGLERVKQFTWEASALQLLRVYAFLTN